MARPRERKFLGFSFTNGKRQARNRAESLDPVPSPNPKHHTANPRHQHGDNDRELAPYIQGWHGYFGFCETLKCWIVY